MSRLIVSADVAGIPTVQIPLPLALDLTQCFRADEIVMAYDYENNHVLVTFPGRDTQTVQKLLDVAHVEASPSYERFAVWPGLHSDVSTIQDPRFGLCYAPNAPASDRSSRPVRPAKTNRFAEAESMARHNKEMQEVTTRKLLAEIRTFIQILTPAQQDTITQLVCSLKTSLAEDLLRALDRT